MLLFFFVVGILFIVAQTTVFQLLPAWFGQPDFVFILVVFSAYRLGWGTGLFFAYLLGWMMDVVGGIHLGVYPLQNVIVFSLLKILAENSPLKENTYQVPLVGVTYFAVQMGLYSLYSIIMPGTLPAWSWNKVIQETLILLLATIPLFVILTFCHDFFRKRRGIRRVISKRGGNQFR